MNPRIAFITLWACLCARLLAAPAQWADTLVLPTQKPPAGKTFAILLTGDGGWAELVRTIGERLSAADIPVVGWNSKVYYNTRRTPEEASRDLARIMTRFREDWNRPRVVLVGYSRGADVLPFLINRLPESERACLDLAVLLGPAQKVDFEIHLGDVLGRAPPKEALPVLPELLKLRGSPLMVLYGKDEKVSCGPDLPLDLGDIRSLPGNHHFNRDYDAISQAVIKSIKLRSEPPTPRPDGEPRSGS